MATYDLGKVVGEAGEKGDDGSTVWNTSTAPTYANSKYTFTISNLSGKTGLQIAVNDIIFYSTYYYIVSTVNTSTVDCSTRVSIKGSDASVTIVDNLTSTSSTSALSAKQGKVLNDNKIETSSIATSFGSTPSDSKVPSEKLTKNTLDTKVDKVTGKGLSTNDFTNSYKNTIDGLSTVATTGDYDDLTDKPTIPSASTTTPSADTSSGAYGSGTSYARANHTHPKSSLYAEATHSHTKSQITDFPSIPSKTSDLTNDGADGTNVFVANNDSRLSDARTPTSHAHGNLTNDGKVGSTANYFVYTTTSGAITSKQKIGNITTSGAIGSTANKPLITTTNGVITTGSFGTTENTFCQGNDSRLSDARTPTAHTHTVSNITDFPIIPTKISDLTNDSDFIEKSSTSGLIKNDGTIDTNSYLTSSALSNYVQKSNTSGLLKNDGSVMTSGTGASDYSAGNHTHSGYVSATKVISWSSTPSDSNVPSEKLVSDTFDAIEDLIGDAIAYINQ